MKAIKTAIIAAVITYLTIQTMGLFPGNLLAPMLAAGSFATVGAAATFMATVTFVGTLIASGVGMLTSRGVDASRDNFGAKLAGKGAAVPRQLIYGQCRVGGTIVKMETSGEDFQILHLAIVLAGHEIQGNDSTPAGVVTLHINELACTTSTNSHYGETVYYVTNAELTASDNDNAFANDRLIRFTFHNGAQTAVDGLANNSLPSSYPSTCKFQGMAYVYMEIVYDPERLASTPNVWFDVKGKKVYDPRDSTTAWSDNPALIVRDILVDDLYGLKALATEINDSSSVGGFQSAAAICDATVSLPVGTEKRYTLNGMSNAAASLDGLLEGFLSSCSGNLTYTNGTFNMFAGGAQTPALTLTDDNVLGEIAISTNAGSGDLYNGVKSIYIDSTNNYLATEVSPYESSTYLAEDTPTGASSANYRKFFEAQLPFTVTNTMAQRLQRIQLRKQRETTTVSLLTTLEFMKCQPSDWVQMTNSRLNYTNKNFEIVSMQMEFLENDGQIFAATRLSLQEVSSGIYDYTASDYVTPQATASTPEAGNMTVPPPTSVAVTQVNAGDFVNVIHLLVTWTNSTSSSVFQTEVQLKKSTEGTGAWATMATVGRGVAQALIQEGVVGVTYNVRVRHISADNVYSVWAT